MLSSSRTRGSMRVSSARCSVMAYEQPCSVLGTKPTLLEAEPFNWANISNSEHSTEFPVPSKRPYYTTFNLNQLPSVHSLKGIDIMPRVARVLCLMCSTMCQDIWRSLPANAIDQDPVRPRSRFAQNCREQLGDAHHNRFFFEATRPSGSADSHRAILLDPRTRIGRFKVWHCSAQ